MNKYFILKVTLQHLDKTNEKIEYRYLRQELYKRAFRDTFFDEFNSEILLPIGMYAILAFEGSGKTILNKAKEAVELALKPYYSAGWSNKYTILVSGPSTVYSENLEHVESN